MQPTLMSLSGMNMCSCSCATHGAVSISAFFPMHFPQPFLSKTLLNLFQTILLQARLLRKA